MLLLLGEALCRVCFARSVTCPTGDAERDRTGIRVRGSLGKGALEHRRREEGTGDEGSEGCKSTLFWRHSIVSGKLTCSQL